MLSTPHCDGSLGSEKAAGAEEIAKGRAATATTEKLQSRPQIWQGQGILAMFRRTVALIEANESGSCSVGHH